MSSRSKPELEGPHPMWRSSCLRRRYLAACGLLLSAVLLVGWFWWDAAIVLKGQRIPVGYSADGKYLATLDIHGRGHLWEAHTGALRDDMGGHVQGLELPFSPDGRYHVAQRFEDPASNYSEASVVETQTGRTLLSFRCWSGALYGGIGFTPDASRFFAVDTPERAGRYSSKIWELPSGREIRTFEEVGAKAISPDGKTLAVFEEGNRDFGNGHLSLWQVDDGRKVLTLLDTDDFTLSATFSSDGGRLAVCRQGGLAATSLMQIFDVQSGEELISKRIPWGHFRNPVFYSGDKLIRLHQQSPMMRLFLGNQPESVWSTEPERFVVAWAADSVSQNGRWAVSVLGQEGSSASEQTIRIYSVTPDAASREPLGKPENLTDFTVNTGDIQATTSRITNNGRYVVIIGNRSGMTGKSDALALVDCKSQKLIRWFSIGNLGWVYHNFEVSPDGSTIAVGILGADKRVDKIKICSICH
jgi:WD40 repeat protein